MLDFNSEYIVCVLELSISENLPAQILGRGVEIRSREIKILLQILSYLNFRLLTLLWKKIFPNVVAIDVNMKLKSCAITLSKLVDEKFQT